MKQVANICYRENLGVNLSVSRSAEIYSIKYVDLKMPWDIRDIVFCKMCSFILRNLDKKDLIRQIIRQRNYLYFTKLPTCLPISYNFLFCILFHDFLIMRIFLFYGWKFGIFIGPKKCTWNIRPLIRLRKINLFFLIRLYLLGLIQL